MTELHSRTKLLWLIVLTLVILPLLISTSQSKPAVIVARVNNQIITLKELENRIDFSRKYVSESKTLTKKSLTYNVLDEIIEERMIGQEGKRVNMAVSESDLSKIISKLRRSQSKLYKRLLSSKNNTPSTKILENKVRASLLWSKILSELVKPSVRNINNPQIIEALEELDRDVSEFKFNISQIKIKKFKGSKIIIDEIYQKLTNREGGVQKILKKYMDQGISLDFLNIGWVSKSTLDDQLYQALFANKDNDYTKPIALNEEYAIFRINKKVLSSNISEEDYRLAQSKIYKSLQISDGGGFLRNLRRRTFIEIYRARINKYLGL